MYTESPPFPRGETQDAASGAFDHLIGREYVVADELPSTTPGAKALRTGRLVTIRLVKNSAAVALLPKRVVKYQTSAGPGYGQVVDGYANATAGDAAGVVDELLPAAGAPVTSYFYIVVRGPSLVLLPLAGSDFNGDVSVGDRLVALTAATSGATTAGRVARENITGATTTADYTFLLNQAANFVGRALSAKTTGATTGTSNDVLADVCLLW